MTAYTVDDYLAAIESCTSHDQLFQVFRAEIEREGFQNVVFARQTGAKISEMPYLSVPDSVVQAYLEQNLEDTDPMVRLVQNRNPSFTWDEMEAQSESKAERDTLGILREAGCGDGFVIPFYGPNGTADVFDLTFRQPTALNTSRLKQVSMKTYATWLRFLEIDSRATAQRVLKQSLAAAEPEAANITLPHHVDGLECISQTECKALVIGDIAARRYKSGLTELNEGLEDTLGRELFHRLRARGPLMEEPDDDHMRYFFKPSPIAAAHLKRCSHVAQVRSDAWRLYARRNERPSDWFLRP